MDAGPRIAIDAMGGDSGPAAMIGGIARAARTDPELSFIVYGDEQLVKAELGRQRGLRAEVSVVHSPESILASEKPSQAIRRARTTSLGMAINAVKEGRTDAAVLEGLGVGPRDGQPAGHPPSSGPSVPTVVALSSATSSSGHWCGI